MNLEDETGFANVLVRSTGWTKHATVARGSNALIVRGRVERAGTVTNLVADHLERLPLATKTTSRNWH